MGHHISRRTFLAGSSALASTVALGPTLSFAQENGALTASFATPPHAARPRVWWHWMNGNVTLEGVQADFEWMKKVGIGGVQNFDAAFTTPQIVDHRIPYLSEEWRQTFRQAVTLADKMNLEFAIAGSPGWSQTGGPWVEPEQAMKKLVWSEKTIAGGQRFTGKLPAPPHATGPFGTIESHGDEDLPHLYKDQVVIAYRAPTPTAIVNGKASVSSSAGDTLDFAKLSNSDYSENLELPFGPEPATTTWIQFTFDAPQTVRALTVKLAGGEGHFGEAAAQSGIIEASDDGVTYREIAIVPGTNIIPRTVAFPATTARYFRVSLTIDRDATVSQGWNQPPKPVTAHEIQELVLHEEPRVNYYEDKAGFWDEPFLTELPAIPVDKAQTIAKEDVRDITDRMAEDGTLDWTPPDGRWVVLRMGYSLTGEENGPASPEGTGLEVDKLNKAHVRAYMDDYLGIYESILGTDMMGEHGLTHLLTDSYEAGATNWTDGMRDKFRARRGYDVTTWLPVLAGRVVESAEESERFLWDYRQTLGDLMADEHYGEISDALHDRGMKRYGESHEDRRAFVGDGMQAKKSADIPMGATWIPEMDFDHASTYMRDADIRESASVSHIYGQNLVAAESLTTPGRAGNAYDYTPWDLKPVVDRMFASGLNRLVVHTSVHQPVDTPGPGIGLGPFGQWFTRKETWADQAGAWVDYVSRSSHMLQQGRFMADIAYFYGEHDNVTRLFRDAPPPVPEGYGYDFVNGDALINELTARDGHIHTPTGMRYRVLALHPASTRLMSLAALRKVQKFVNAGVVVVGQKPEASPALADDPQTFRRLADELWNGKVVTSSLEDAMANVIEPDFSYQAGPDTRLLFVHRHTDDREIYYVNTRNTEAETVTASFRVVGRVPRLWRADTGTVEDISYSMENGRTSVSLDLAPGDSVFVVFGEPTDRRSVEIPAPQVTELAALSAPSDVSFRLPDGEAYAATLPELTSWTSSSDPEIRYFSGTATYTKELSLQPPRSGKVVLDLGGVARLAEVVVNGKTAGVAWKPPYTVDVTDALRPGKNRLEIKVINTWPNRLIGDKQPGAEKHVSAVHDPFTADTPLRDSGLFGPVKLIHKQPR